MALKRRNRIEASFSMASMTDVIFLLLIFFMVTSTFVFPNAIKVLLPQSKEQTAVTIDAQLNYYVSFGNEAEHPVQLEEIAPYLLSALSKEPDMYVALYADESVPYREVVKVLNIAGENKLRMVLATRPIKE